MSFQVCYSEARFLENNGGGICVITESLKKRDAARHYVLNEAAEATCLSLGGYCEWNDQMEVFLPFLSEEFFRITWEEEIECSLQTSCALA